MIILDTDIISLLDEQSGEAAENLKRRLSSPEVTHVYVTIVSFEQMRGWLSYIAPSKALHRQVEGYSRLLRMVRWYQRQQILPFDSAAAREFETPKRGRIKVGTMDLKIASIALASNLLLVSRNVRDFRNVPELRVEDWTQPE